MKSRGSVVGIVSGYRLDNKGSEFESKSGQKSSLLHIVQSGSVAQPASYPMGSASYFPGAKQQGREADNSHPTSAEVKKPRIYTTIYTSIYPLPQYAFMA
jgi:hypothetical protein